MLGNKVTCKAFSFSGEQRVELIVAFEIPAIEIISPAPASSTDIFQGNKVIKTK